MFGEGTWGGGGGGRSNGDRFADDDDPLSTNITRPSRDTIGPRRRMGGGAADSPAAATSVFAWPSEWS